MLTTTLRRSFFCGVLTCIITLVFGHLRFFNGLADQQQYQPGISIKDPMQFRYYLVWPLLAAVLPIASILIQLFWERISKKNTSVTVGKIFVGLICCYVLSFLASLPSFQVTYSPNVWDNFDPALKWFPVMSVTFAIVFTNILARVLSNAQQQV
jgi:hypothetical protein